MRGDKVSELVAQCKIQGMAISNTVLGQSAPIKDGLYLFFNTVCSFLFLGDTSESPPSPELPSFFEILSLNFKNSQFSFMNFQLFLIWTLPSILTVKIF